MKVAKDEKKKKKEKILRHSEETLK